MPNSVVCYCRLRVYIYNVGLFVLQGMSLVWESYKLDPYVQRLADSVFEFQEKVSALFFAAQTVKVIISSRRKSLRKQFFSPIDL